MQSVSLQKVNMGICFAKKVKKDLFITIADCGKTIYGSYVDTNKYINEIGTNEAEALRIANEGFSTKDRPGAENRGYGISKSREMIVNGLRGAFFMRREQPFIGTTRMV